MPKRDTPIGRELNPIKVPRDQLRATQHHHGLEVGDLAERFGVMPLQFGRGGMFPLRQPRGNPAFWEHSNGAESVTIQPGVIHDANRKPRLTIYPSGGLARLITADITSEIRSKLARNEDPYFIDLTPYPSRYLTERLGIQWAGNRKQAVIDQLLAVALSQITVTTTTQLDGGTEVRGWLPPRVADAYRIWFPNQPTLEGFEPYIRPSREFVRQVAENEVMPLRRDLYAQLVGKPMAMDILGWLTAVTFWIDHTGRTELTFTWNELYTRFPHEYSRLNNFVTYWKKALTEALRYYPDLRFAYITGTRTRPGGIKIMRSRLLIEKQAQRRLF